jgi:hypothetical protein
MKHSIYPSVVALVTLAMAGCAPIHQSSANLKDKALRFRPAEGRSAVYVIRPNQFVAAGSALPVFLDHEKFGSLPPKSYLYCEVLPREHALELAELPGAKPVVVRFNAETGRCHFFYARANLGGFVLDQMEESEGQKRVRASSLSGDNRFEAPKISGSPKSSIDVK